MVDLIDLGFWGFLELWRKVEDKECEETKKMVFFFFFFVICLVHMKCMNLREYGKLNVTFWFDVSF